MYRNTGPGTGAPTASRRDNGRVRAVRYGMFSHRVPADHTANRLSTAIEARRARGAPLLDLTESNPTRCGFRHDEPALLAALASPGALRYEPHPQGLLSARPRWPAYYAEAGVPVDPESLFLTTGTSEAYAQVFKLLADPGRRDPRPDAGLPAPGRADAGWRRSGWSRTCSATASGMDHRHRAPAGQHQHAHAGHRGGQPEQPHRLVSQARRAGRAERAVPQLRLRPHRGRGVLGLRRGDRRRARAHRGPQRRGAHLHAERILKARRAAAGEAGLDPVSGPAETVRAARERLSFVTDAYLSVSAAVQHAAPAILAPARGSPGADQPPPARTTAGPCRSACAAGVILPRPAPRGRVVCDRAESPTTRPTRTS